MIGEIEKMALSEILKEDDRGRLYVMVHPTGFWERIALLWYSFWFPDRYGFVGIIQKDVYMKLVDPIKEVS